MNKYIDLFITFFYIGITTFGGGYAMLSLIKGIVVDKKQWLTEDELLEMTIIAESTPGPIAVNLSTYCGYKLKGITGSIISTLAMVLPSFIIIFIIALLMNAFLENEVVVAVFKGIKCAVVFLIINSGIKMFKAMKKTMFSLIVFFSLILVLTMLSLLAINLTSIVYIILGGILGFVFLRTPKEVVE